MPGAPLAGAIDPWMHGTWVGLRERHHRLDRWRNLLPGQAERTPTKPTIRGIPVAAAVIMSDSFRLYGVLNTVVGMAIHAQGVARRGSQQNGNDWIFVNCEPAPRAAPRPPDILTGDQGRAFRACPAVIS
jgi:hypothetical protein